MIELRVLGTASLRVREDPREAAEASVSAVLTQPKRLALLVFLTLSRARGPVRRDELLGLFWPETDEARARHALSQSLYVIRQELGGAVLRTEGNGSVAVDPGTLWCDAVAFDEALRAGDPEGALELYGGPLLPSFYLDGCPAFDEWVEAERSRLAVQAASAATELAEEARARGDLEAAIRWRERHLKLAPYDEAALADLVELLALSGDRGGAVIRFREFAERLERELGLEPSAELVELVEGLKEQNGGAGWLAARIEPEPAGDPERPSVGITSVSPRSLLHRIASRPAALLGLGAVLFLGLGIAGFLAWRPATLGVDRTDELLITEFESPGDELLGRTASELLRVSFDMSRLMRVPAEASVADALERMLAEGSTPGPDEALELAVREGWELVALGEIRPMGNGYVVTARLVEPGTGEVLGRFRATAREPDGFVDAVDEIAAAVHARIGASRRSIREAPALAQVTTSSLEALKAYTEADRLRNVEGRAEDAVPLLERAIAKDSTFGAAYRKLFITLNNLGRDRARQQEMLRQASRHRERMTPYQRMLTEDHLEPLETPADAETFFARKIRRYEDFLRLYPEQVSAWQNLGVYYVYAGRYGDAVDAYERALGGAPEKTVLWDNLVAARVWAGDLEGAERDLDRLRGTPWYTSKLGALALAHGNVREAHDVWADESPPDLYRLAWTDAALGRLAEAEEHLRAALTRAESAGSAGRVLGTAASLAFLTATFFPERSDDARRVLDAALRTHASDSIQLGEGLPDAHLARAYAAVGDTRRARAHLAAMIANRPYMEVWTPGVYAQGQVLLAEGRPREAIEILRDGHRFLPFFERMLLAPLARAYEAAGMPDSALVAYERLLGHRDVFFNQGTWLPHLAPAHRSLARLYEARADTARAAEHYSRFVDLWRDADPELRPRVVEAEGRLLALRGAAAGRPR